MPHFLKKIFGSKNKDSSKFFNRVKNMSLLSHEINKKTNELNQLEYEIISENKNDTYISLADFLELMDKKNLELKDILSRCKHISDIDSSNFSFIDVYPIIKENVLILSLDKSDQYLGEKMRIATVRIKNA